MDLQISEKEKLVINSFIDCYTKSPGFKILITLSTSSKWES